MTMIVPQPSPGHIDMSSLCYSMEIIRLGYSVCGDKINTTLKHV